MDRGDDIRPALWLAPSQETCAEIVTWSILLVFKRLKIKRSLLGGRSGMQTFQGGWCKQCIKSKSIGIKMDDFVRAHDCDHCLTGAIC